VFFRERLRPDHDVSGFTCGNEMLDRWLRQSALGADRSGTGRTYLWVDETGAVAAYFTLAPHLVRRSDVPQSVGRGAPDAIPAVILARLALARILQSQGHGSMLLADALTVALEAIAVAGGRLIVVDALDERAHAFYRHHRFVPVPGDEHRLVIKAADAARSLGLPRP
jgi:GNAT superfamily N-acetyltransferase